MCLPEIEFVAEPPPRVKRNPVTPLEEFAAVLRNRPNEWGIWPKEFPAPSGYATGIRRGTALGFREGVFDAVMRNGVLYVCYLRDGDD